MKLEDIKWGDLVRYVGPGCSGIQGVGIVTELDPPDAGLSYPVLVVFKDSVGSRYSLHCEPTELEKSRRCRLKINGPYTDVWLDGVYSRIPWHCGEAEATRFIENFRKRTKSLDPA